MESGTASSTIFAVGVRLDRDAGVLHVCSVGPRGRALRARRVVEPRQVAELARRAGHADPHELAGLLFPGSVGSQLERAQRDGVVRVHLALDGGGPELTRALHRLRVEDALSSRNLQIVRVGCVAAGRDLMPVTAARALVVVDDRDPANAELLNRIEMTGNGRMRVAIAEIGCDIAEFRRELDLVKPHLVLHLAHLDGRGVSFAGRAASLDLGDYGELLAERGVQVAALLGCASRQHAPGLLEAGIPATITTLSPVTTPVMLRAAANLTRSLAGGGALDEAVLDFGREPSLAGPAVALHLAGSAYRLVAPVNEHASLRRAAERLIDMLPIPGGSGGSGLLDRLVRA